MSARNRQQAKKLRSLERIIRKGRLPAYIDLIQWLRDRRYASTAGGAREIIEAGRVRSESHTLGSRLALDRTGQKTQVFEQYVPARLRDTIRVEPQHAER